MMSPRTLWLLRVLTWDGLLPILVFLGMFFLRWADPRNVGPQAFVALLLPPLLALIRSHLAWSQIAEACDGRVPVLRQVTVACAIVFLMCFELSAAVLTLAKDEPHEAWLFPCGCYFVYLLAIGWALRPNPQLEVAA